MWSIWSHWSCSWLSPLSSSSNEAFMLNFKHACLWLNFPKAPEVLLLQTLHFCTPTNTVTCSLALSFRAPTGLTSPARDPAHGSGVSSSVLRLQSLPLKLPCRSTCLHPWPWPCVLDWYRTHTVHSLLPGWIPPCSLPFLATSPGWTLDPHYSLVSGLVSGPVSFCSWLDSLEGCWTWFITLSCLGQSMDTVTSLCWSAVGLDPARWGYCLCWGHLWLQAPVPSGSRQTLQLPDTRRGDSVSKINHLPWIHWALDQPMDSFV